MWFNFDNFRNTVGWGNKLKNHQIVHSCLKNKQDNKSLHNWYVSILITVTGFGLFANEALSQQVIVESGNPQCSIVGTTATCSGDLSGGVRVPFFSDIDTLNINDLDSAISPILDVGISFTNPSGDININANTGGFGIQTITNFSSGISGNSLNGGNISIDSLGDIHTSGNFAAGINAFVDNDTGIFSRFSNGSILINNASSITTMGEFSAGIFGQTQGNGNISVFNSGNIETHNDNSDSLTALIFGNGDFISENNGNILTEGSRSSGIFGLITGNGNSTTVNSGNITTRGASSEAFFHSVVGSGDIHITNTGTIVTEGESAEGFQSTLLDSGNINTINAGEIYTLGENSDGIASFIGGFGNIVTDNSADISTSGVDATGISAFVQQLGDVVVNNTGNIITTGMESIGISAGIFDDGIAFGNADLTISTNGNVTANNSIGIAAFSDASGNIQINTAGTVTGETGILVLERANNAPVTINNSGVITGSGGTAINLQGNGNDTINLTAGSIINGTIDFGNGNDSNGGTNPDDIDTLNIGRGINAIITFADAGGAGQGDSDLASAPEIINVDGIFSLNDDGTALNVVTELVVIDPTSFSSSDVFVSDLSGSINNLLNRVSETTVTQISTHGSDDNFANEGEDNGARFWLSGFGGSSQSDNVSAGINNIENNFAGFAGGIETGLEHQGVWGVFGGSANSDIRNDFGSSTLEVDSVFGGIYYKRDYGEYRINAAFTAGTADHESTRRFIVGNENSVADFDGEFYSGSLTASIPMNVLSVPANLSGRLSYTNIQLDGYTEIGGAAPLTVAERDVNVFGVRAQVNLPKTLVQDSGIHSHFDFNFGVDSQFFDSDTVVAIGPSSTAFNFSAEVSDRLSGFVGAGLSITSADGSETLGLFGEVQTDFNDDTRLSGEVKATFKF